MEVQAECFSMCGHWGQPGGEAFAVMEESQAGGGRPLERTSLCCLLESGVNGWKDSLVSLVAQW